MRAFLKTDPAAGAGYGLIEVHDAGEAEDPTLIIKRVSDGKTLGYGGWRSGANDLRPLSWEVSGDRLYLKIGPQIVDNLAPGAHYELEIPGVGRCPLAGSATQSIIMENMDPLLQNGGLMAQIPSQAGRGGEAGREIYEGVEATPEESPGAGEAAAPEGILPPSPAGTIIDKPKKKHGCLVLFLFFLVVWIGGAWALWQFSMNSPAPEVSGKEDSKSFRFEIIPASKERTHPDDDFEEEDGKP